MRYIDKPYLLKAGFYGHLEKSLKMHQAPAVQN